MPNLPLLQQRRQLLPLLRRVQQLQHRKMLLKRHLHQPSPHHKLLPLLQNHPLKLPPCLQKMFSQKNSITINRQLMSNLTHVDAILSPNSS